MTEAIHKTKWIIATKAGGIPLQIRDGIDGRLVGSANPKDIGNALIEFYSSIPNEPTSPTTPRAPRRGSVAGTRPLGGRWDDLGDGPREELFSVGNATMWQVSLIITLLPYQSAQFWGCSTWSARF